MCVPAVCACGASPNPTLYLCLYLCLGSGVAAFSEDDVNEDTRYGFDDDEDDDDDDDSPEDAGGDDRVLFIVSSLSFIDDRVLFILPPSPPPDNAPLEPWRSRRFFLASSSTSRRTDLGRGMGR